MDCSPPGSSLHGISRARILDWVAISPGDVPDPGIIPILLHYSEILCCWATREAPPPTLCWRGTLQRRQDKTSSPIRYHSDPELLLSVFPRTPSRRRQEAGILRDPHEAPALIPSGLASLFSTLNTFASLGWGQKTSPGWFQFWKKPLDFAGYRFHYWVIQDLDLGN